eukprot:GSA120T00012918001.1
MASLAFSYKKWDSLLTDSEDSEDDDSKGSARPETRPKEVTSDDEKLLHTACRDKGPNANKNLSALFQRPIMKDYFALFTPHGLELVPIAGRKYEGGVLSKFEALTAHNLDAWYRTAKLPHKEHAEMVKTSRYDIVRLDEPDFGYEPYLDAPVPPRPRLSLGRTNDHVTFKDLGFDRQTHMVVVAVIDIRFQFDRRVMFGGDFLMEDALGSPSLPKHYWTQDVDEDEKRKTGEAGGNSVAICASTGGAGGSGRPVSERSLACPFFRFDLVEIHSLCPKTNSKAAELNGKRAFVEDAHHPEIPGKVVIRFPGQKNKKVMDIWPGNLRLVSQDPDEPDDAAKDASNGPGGSEPAAAEEEAFFVQHAEETLSRLRAA